jgi:hypothetical protein
MEKQKFGRIREKIINVKKPLEIAVLTFAISIGAKSAIPTGTQADYSNPPITSELTSQYKTLQAIVNVKCTTKPSIPNPSEIKNLESQIVFAYTDTVPCVEVDYSDGSKVVFVSPLAYSHPRIATDGTYLFPKLCILPGIAEPVEGPAGAILVSKNDLGLPSYCVFPPIEKGKSSIELLPLAPQKSGQNEKQSHGS